MFQLGEGWHSNENAIRFWHSSPRGPKGADSRCYASAATYATMIRLCNGAEQPLQRRTRSQNYSWRPLARAVAGHSVDAVLAERARSLDVLSSLAGVWNSCAEHGMGRIQVLSLF